MSQVPHLLLLAGSGEARAIADALSRTGLRVTASIMNNDHWSGPLPVPTRTGGFGGAQGFSEFLTDQDVTAVLDATHPFATRISERSWAICRDIGLPYVQVDRPGWTARPGDTWHFVDDAAAALDLIPQGARVFTTAGRDALGVLTRRGDVTFFNRRLAVSGPASEYANVTFVYGLGPFAKEEEITTLRGLNVDMLICKNSGGLPSRSKLVAARDLGLPVILLNRPPPTGAPVVRDVAGALDWVARACP